MTSTAQNNNHQLMFRAAQVSLFGNVCLFILKATALVLVNSLAIAADLGITVVGLIVSVILYYSLKLADRPADSLHNYGYGKIEHVCEALESIVLIGITIALSFQSAISFLHPSKITAPWLGFGFSVVSASVNFMASVWIIALAKRCTSPAVRAEGIHWRLESFISLVIAGSFFLMTLLSSTPLKAWAVYVDPTATLTVSFLIAFPSLRLAKQAFIKLLDASIEEKGKMEVMKQLANYINQCCEFRDIRSRSSGRTNYVELKLVVPPSMSLVDAHRLATNMERDLRANIPECEATVMIVPCTENCVSHISIGTVLPSTG
jgi:cation diffusion facilitator family transporter